MVPVRETTTVTTPFGLCVDGASDPSVPVGPTSDETPRPGFMWGSSPLRKTRSTTGLIQNYLPSIPLFMEGSFPSRRARRPCRHRLRDSDLCRRVQDLLSHRPIPTRVPVPFLTFLSGVPVSGFDTERDSRRLWFGRPKVGTRGRTPSRRRRVVSRGGKEESS